MSSFEIKYLKEVITNLKIIVEDFEYKYTLNSIIEDLESFVKECE